MALPNQKLNIAESRAAEACPYCQSKEFVKRGLRKNQLGSVQLYLCRNPECWHMPEFLIFNYQFLVFNQFLNT
jgi:hypothetical protein